MSVTLQNLYDRIDDLRVDTSSGSVDVASEGLRAINAQLDELQSIHDWEHTLKEFRFRYYPRVTKYGPLPSNYKNPRALAPISNFLDEFRRLEPSIFDHLVSVYERDNYFSIFEDSTGTYLQTFMYRTRAKSTTINLDTSLTGDGTWSANTVTSDAANIAADNIVYYENTGSITFDVTVGQSVNNFAEIVNSTMSAKDLTDYKKGKVFCKLGIPSVTNLSSITIRLGSSAANYREQTITTQTNGEALVAGVNFLGFDLESATTTGSPTLTSITYVLFRVNYTASYTSQMNFRLGEIFASTYEDMIFRYYSTNTVNDISVPTTVDRFDGTTNDTLMFPDIFKEALCYGAASELLLQMEMPEMATKRERQAQEMIASLIARWPAKTLFPEPPSLFPGSQWFL